MTIIILTFTAFVLSFFIVAIDNAIKIDEEETSQIEELLPGLNCGGCGFGTCKGMACKILEEKDNYKKCRPLRGEKLEKFLAEVDNHLK